MLDILRRNEITCSVEVVKEIFDEEKMVMLYRFSMEAEKAKNSVDLNVADKVDNGDHIVPNVGYHNGTTNIRSTAFPMNPPTAYGIFLLTDSINMYTVIKLVYTCCFVEHILSFNCIQVV